MLLPISNFLDVVKSNYFTDLLMPLIQFFFMFLNIELVAVEVTFTASIQDIVSSETEYMILFSFSSLEICWQERSPTNVNKMI